MKSRCSQNVHSTLIPFPHVRINTPLFSKPYVAIKVWTSETESPTFPFFVRKMSAMDNSTPWLYGRLLWTDLLCVFCLLQFT